VLLALLLGVLQRIYGPLVSSFLLISENEANFCDKWVYSLIFFWEKKERGYNGGILWRAG